MKKMRSLVALVLDYLRRLWTSLGKAPTIIYVILYLLVILVFSLVYTGMSGRHFYHSTSQYEDAYLNPDAIEILADIETEISSAFTDEYGTSQVDLDGWQLDIDALDTNSLYVGDFPETFGFRVTVPISYTYTDGNFIWSMIASEVVVTVKPIFIRGRTTYSLAELNSAAIPKIEAVPDHPKPEVLFPGITGTSTAAGIILPLSKDLHTQILNFGQAYRGFPSGASGHYWRMLYLSAGIATSTALGDIVPISNTARLFVTIEAVMALIILGLFLNALVFDIGQRFQGSRTS